MNCFRFNLPQKKARTGVEECLNIMFHNTNGNIIKLFTICTKNIILLR